jgi:hypothetical protein
MPKNAMYFLNESIEGLRDLWDEIIYTPEARPGLTQGRGQRCQAAAASWQLTMSSFDTTFQGFRQTSQRDPTRSHKQNASI